MKQKHLFVCAVGIIIILGLACINDWMTRTYHYKFINSKKNNATCRGMFPSALHWIAQIVYMLGVIVFFGVLALSLRQYPFFENSMGFLMDDQYTDVWLAVMVIVGMVVCVLGIVEYKVMGKETNDVMYRFSDSGKHILFIIVLIALLVGIIYQGKMWLKPDNTDVQRKMWRDKVEDTTTDEV